MTPLIDFPWGFLFCWREWCAGGFFFLIPAFLFLFLFHYLLLISNLKLKQISSVAAGQRYLPKDYTVILTSFQMGQKDSEFIPMQ